MNTTEVTCPCCGDSMARENVVCWECYRATNRLSSGVHLDANGCFTVSAEDIASWDKARLSRSSL